jgi:hypothetical protein
MLKPTQLFSSINAVMPFYFIFQFIYQKREFKHSVFCVNRLVIFISKITKKETFIELFNGLV